MIVKYFIKSMQCLGYKEFSIVREFLRNIASYLDKQQTPLNQ